MSSLELKHTSRATAGHASTSAGMWAAAQRSQHRAQLTPDTRGLQQRTVNFRVEHFFPPVKQRAGSVKQQSHGIRSVVTGAISVDPRVSRLCHSPGPALPLHLPGLGILHGHVLTAGGIRGRFHLPNEP